MKKLAFGLLVLVIVTTWVMTSSCTTQISTPIGTSSAPPALSTTLSPSPTITASPAASPTLTVTTNATEENRAEVIESDVRLTISADKRTYFHGEIVTVNASVENLSPNTIRHTHSSLGDPTPYVHLERNPYFEGFALEEPELGGVRTVAPLVTVSQLRPYEVVSRKVVWDQKILFRSQQAPQGTYTVVSSIVLGDYYQDRSSTKTVAVRLSIQLANAPKWITPDQAKNIALALPDVKAWIEAHSGKNVVKQEDGQAFVFFTDGWQKVSPYFTYSEDTRNLNLDTLRQWSPEATVQLDNGAWLVSMGTKLGPKPHFVRVRVDQVTSAVIEVWMSEY